jgi:hypothetical protein
MFEIICDLATLRSGLGHIKRFEADPRGSFDGAWFASASPGSGGCTVPAGGRFGVQNTAGWP